MTVAELLTTATTQLTDAGIPDPELDAEWLLTHCLGCQRIDLQLEAARKVDSEVLSKFNLLLTRRLTREPLQYILGTQEFYGRSFRVTPDVLIPRPETERLTELALQQLSGGPCRVLDIGTGSGCIALTIALEQPNTTVVGTDQSAAALAIARSNAQLHNAERRVQFVEADLFPPSPGEPFDLIISNPPYIPERDWPTLQPEVRDFEPKPALTAAEDGLAIIRRIIQGASGWLKPQGWLALEIGKGQEESVKQIIADTQNYSAPELQSDYQKVTRFVFVLNI